MKVKKITFIIGIFFFCYYEVSAQEIRGGVELEYGFIDKVETEFQFQLRNCMRNNSHIINQGIVQTAIEYCPVQCLNISCAYRYTTGIKKDNENAGINNNIEGKHRITTDISFKIKDLFKDAKISNRIRYQFSVKERDTQKFYLRNKLKCEYKLAKKVSPYAALEPFYSIEKNCIKTFRLYIGGEFELLRNTIDIYIINELSSKNEQYSSYRIVGLSYKL